MRRSSLHLHAAGWWLLAAPVALAPALARSPRADAGTVIAWGIVVVTMAIIGAGALVTHWKAWRRWYGWGDAISAAQRQAIMQRSARAFFLAGWRDGFPQRARPYLLRILCSVAALEALMLAAPHDGLGMPALDALCLFLPWYPLGAALVLGAAAFPRSPWFERLLGIHP